MNPLVEQESKVDSGAQAPPLVSAPREGRRGLRPPLSFAQHRLWFIDQLEPGIATYNIPAAVRLEGRLNIEALESAINEIVRRHEVLRTRVVGGRVGLWQSPDKSELMELWASVGEYPIYDGVSYNVMSTDQRRNNSYRAALNQLVKDKVVVDVGTGGDAILARFCIEAGAKKVYAIEVLEDSYRLAGALIKRLGLEDKITLIHGFSSEVELPEKVDVCVSEIVGTIGSSEGMVPVLNDARRFLKDGGTMIPQRCLTKIAAVRLPDAISNEPGFTENPPYYAKKVFEQVGYLFDIRLTIKNFPKSHLVSSIETFESLDFTDYVVPESHCDVSFVINQDTRLDGFLLWLNLQTIDGELIDTLEEEYNWHPVYFPAFESGIRVVKGDIIKATCHSVLSDNGVNPDYAIEGYVVRQNGEMIDFAYESPHHKPAYKKTAFYKSLFDGDDIKIKSLEWMPVQVIDEWVPRKLEIEDLTGMSGREREEEVRRITKEEMRTGFDLSRGPLLRVRVLKLGEDEHALLYTMHHIISDGWSTGILARELCELYAAMSEGQGSPLPELPIQYADYAIWQREYLAGGALENDIGYWKEQLRDAAVMELPADRSRPAAPSYRGGLERVEIGEELTEGLRKLSQQEGATLFMALMAAFKVLLMRYSGEEDVSVGTVIANRTRKEVEGLIGFFATTLVMRTNLEANPSFRELIRREREVALGAYAHQDTPFEKVMEEINPQRNLSRSPLFQVMMAFQNPGQETTEIRGLKLMEIGEEPEVAEFDLSLMLSEGTEGVMGHLQYSRDLYDGATVARMARHFEHVVAEVIRDAEQPIGEIDLT